MNQPLIFVCNHLVSLKLSRFKKTTGDFYLYIILWNYYCAKWEKWMIVTMVTMIKSK